MNQGKTLRAEARSEKPEAKSQKRKARSEKPEAKSQKRKARSQKLSYFITPREAIPILSREVFFTRYIISSA
jgi:hypothetical protein